MFQVPNEYREKIGKYASNEGYGNNGMFIIKSPNGYDDLNVLASDGEGWEHVSVSMPRRTPSWEEMCFIKSIFWDSDDVVIQYHPAEEEYVNFHPHCLHLWRKIGHKFETPPTYMVGPAT